MDPLKELATFDAKKKAFSLFDEFKKFAFKGNVVDLALGVIIGAAFGAIVKSLVEDIIMPLVGLVLPGDKGYEELEIGKSRRLRRRCSYGKFLAAVVSTTMLDGVGAVHLHRQVPRLHHAVQERRSRRPTAADQGSGAPDGDPRLAETKACGIGKDARRKLTTVRVQRRYDRARIVQQRHRPIHGLYSSRLRLALPSLSASEGHLMPFFAGAQARTTCNPEQRYEYAASLPVYKPCVVSHLKLLHVRRIDFAFILMGTVRAQRSANRWLGVSS